MTIFNSLEFFAYLALTSKEYENLFKKTSKGKYGLLICRRDQKKSLWGVSEL